MSQKASQPKQTAPDPGSQTPPAGNQAPPSSHRLLTRIIMLLLAIFVAGGSAFGILATPQYAADQAARSGQEPAALQDAGALSAAVEKDGWYSDKEHVAAYIWAYDALPDNYLTKAEAQALGWDSAAGNLWDVAEGMSIGGDVFGNYEGQLPKEKGRVYHECDIDYAGGYRNAKRLIYSSDGLIYYTEDHYETFEELTRDD